MCLSRWLQVVLICRFAITCCALDCGLLSYISPVAFSKGWLSLWVFVFSELRVDLTSDSLLLIFLRQED